MTTSAAHTNHITSSSSAAAASSSSSITSSSLGMSNEYQLSDLLNDNGTIKFENQKSVFNFFQSRPKCWFIFNIMTELHHTNDKTTQINHILFHFVCVVICKQYYYWVMLGTIIIL